MTILATTISVLLACACLAWFGMAAAIHRNLRPAPWLRKLRPPEPTTWPSLSLVIPARDEAETLEAAMASRRAEDYPAMDLVLVDDRSTDGTGAMADAPADAEPRLRVLHLDTLPSGWLGKVHAMQRGVEAATGDWVLLTDADVHIAPGTLRRAVAHCEAEGLDFLAVVPRMRPVSLLLDATLVVFLQLICLGLRHRAVADPDSPVGMGSGSFNLVRRELLMEHGLLERVRLEVADDLALGLAAKAAGLRCGVLLGGDAVQVTFYPSLGAMFRGSEKNGYAVLGRYSLWRTWLGSTAFLLVWLGPLLALGAWWQPGLQILGAVTLMLATAQLGGLARSNGWSPLVALLWPVGAVLFTAMMLRSGWLGWRRGGLVWRDSFYPTAMLKDGSGDAMGTVFSGEGPKKS
jgi:glycosyltransferase involved in cell wall biosynthesis